MNVFRDAQRRLRNGWWIALFFVVLAALLVPFLIAARHDGVELSPLQQAAIIAAASWACLRLRRESFASLTGRLDAHFARELALGGLLGAALMLLPALFQLAAGWTTFRWSPAGWSSLGPSLRVFVGVALAEELLFRGFLFQRLIEGLGAWRAQSLLAALFLLTHLGNPGMVGGTRLLAGANIFLASFAFGLAYLRTRSLAMPIGLHFMANFVQGSMLGYGVSGEAQAGLLTPAFHGAPVGLTGGEFGLEASVPGLVSVIALLALLSRLPPMRGHAASPGPDFESK